MKTALKSSEASPQSHDNNIRLKLLPTLLEVYLRYICYCQKQPFFEDQYNQIKELQNGKNSLCFSCHNRINNRCNYSRAKRNILKNLDFFSFRILINQFYNMVYDLLRFSFPKLTYRSTRLQLQSWPKFNFYFSIIFC